MLPGLPASSLAALRGTCTAMHSLSDQHIGATWLAAASPLLPRGCLHSLQCQPDAASIQGQLQAQVLAERAIMQGGGHAVLQSHKKLIKAKKYPVLRAQWSPCNSMICCHD